MLKKCENLLQRSEFKRLNVKRINIYNASSNLSPYGGIRRGLLNLSNGLSGK
jgi:hypothetical protein